MCDRNCIEDYIMHFQTVPRFHIIPTFFFLLFYNYTQPFLSDVQPLCCSRFLLFSCLVVASSLPSFPFFLLKFTPFFSPLLIYGWGGSSRARLPPPLPLDTTPWSPLQPTLSTSITWVLPLLGSICRKRLPPSRACLSSPPLPPHLPPPPSEG